MILPRPTISPDQAFPTPSYYHSPLLESLAEHTNIGRGHGLVLCPFSSTRALTYVKFGESRRIPYFLVMVACL